ELKCRASHFCRGQAQQFRPFSIAKEQVEWEEGRFQGMSAWLVPEQYPAGEYANREDPHVHASAICDDVAIVRFIVGGGNRLARARIEQMVRYLHCVKLARSNDFLHRRRLAGPCEPNEPNQPLIAQPRKHIEDRTEYIAWRNGIRLVATFYGEAIVQL